MAQAGIDAFRPKVFTKGFRTVWSPSPLSPMVTQRCNWSAEPYTVEFFMRSPGSPWGWCYIDHEANRWRAVAMTYDSASDTVVVTERGIRRAALNRTRSAFWIDNGSIRRELAAPQDFHEPAFAFP